MEELERFKCEHSQNNNESGDMCSNNEKTDENSTSRKKATAAGTSVLTGNGTKHQRMDSTGVPPQRSGTSKVPVNSTGQQLSTPAPSETFYGISFPGHTEGSLGRTFPPGTVPPDVTEMEMFSGQYPQDTSFLLGSDAGEYEFNGRELNSMAPL